MNEKNKMRSRYLFSPYANLYLKDGEKFEIYMDPLQWLRYNLNMKEEYKSPLKDILLSVFQDKLHTLLYQFINGEGLSRRSILLFPIFDRFTPSYSNLLEDLLFLTKNLNRFADFQKSEAVLSINLNNITPVHISQVIATLYSDFENNVEMLNSSIKKKIVKNIKLFSNEIYLSYNPPFLKPIVDLKQFTERHIREMLVDYYIHGSMATLDYVKGWSDVDTLMIIKRDIATNAKKLLKLRRYAYEATKYFYCIDPLQHHGHFVLTEIDLAYYPQPYFPLVLFDYSLSFFGNNEIVIHERDCEIERLNTLWNTCYYFRKKYILNKPITDIFELKMFLHILQLLPLAYLQANGQYCYKKYSFDLVKKEFSEKDWTIIEKATKIRSEWQYKGVFNNILMRKIFEILPNPKVYFMLNHVINKQIPKKVDEMLGKKYYEDTLQLAEQMLERGIKK